jgi:hypothetical protein
MAVIRGGEGGVSSAIIQVYYKNSKTQAFSKGSTVFTRCFPPLDMEL